VPGMTAMRRAIVSGRGAASALTAVSPNIAAMINTLCRFTIYSTKIFESSATLRTKCTPGLRSIKARC
jgi:hypothetical protein